MSKLYTNRVNYSIDYVFIIVDFPLLIDCCCYVIETITFVNYKHHNYYYYSNLKREMERYVIYMNLFVEFYLFVMTFTSFAMCWISFVKISSEVCT